MKYLILSFGILVTSLAFSQNTTISTILVTPKASDHNQQINQLHLLPWDTTQLVQLRNL